MSSLQLCLIVITFTRSLFMMIGALWWKQSLWEDLCVKTLNIVRPLLSMIVGFWNANKMSVVDHGKHDFSANAFMTCIEHEKGLLHGCEKVLHWVWKQCLLQHGLCTPWFQCFCVKTPCFLAQIKWKSKQPWWELKNWLKSRQKMSSFTFVIASQSTSRCQCQKTHEVCFMSMVSTNFAVNMWHQGWCWQSCLLLKFFKSIVVQIFSSAKDWMLQWTLS